LPSEWGAVGNARFLVSSLGSVTPLASALAADVYNIFFTGMESYAVVEQNGYSASFIYRPSIYDGPLALNSSVGKMYADFKFSLIDLEAPRGDRAQAAFAVA
jgi:hypothetical protein